MSNLLFEQGIEVFCPTTISNKVLNYAQCAVSQTRGYVDCENIVEMLATPTPLVMNNRLEEHTGTNSRVESSIAYVSELLHGNKELIKAKSIGIHINALFCETKSEKESSLIPSARVLMSFNEEDKNQGIYRGRSVMVAVANYLCGNDLYDHIFEAQEGLAKSDQSMTEIETGKKSSYYEYLMNSKSALHNKVLVPISINHIAITKRAILYSDRKGWIASTFKVIANS